jgi:hypothetical protein
LNVHGISDIRQTEIHKAEPFVLEPRASEFKMATENFKMYKSPAFITFQQNWFKKEVADCVVELTKREIGDYVVELIQPGGRRLRCEIH